MNQRKNSMLFLFDIYLYTTDLSNLKIDVIQ